MPSGEGRPVIRCDLISAITNAGDRKAILDAVDVTMRGIADFTNFERRETRQ